MSHALNLMVVLPPALAVLVAIVAGLILRAKLMRRMGLPNWEFTKSWASTITVVGGVLSFAAALALIPATPSAPPLTHAQYMTFSLVFPVIIAIAPLIYNFSSGVGENLTVKGWGFTFVFASIFTIWGAFGQLGIEILLVKEICNSVDITPPFSDVLDAPLCLLELALLGYAVRSIVATVAAQPAAGTLEARAVHTTRWALL